jgi:hypothetical protein
MLATALPSHAGDGAIEVTWSRRCRGDLAVARCRVMLAMVLQSHAGDGVAEATWP